jgi:2,3-dihydroxyphenylpropionate 1,2-dioxygenase
LGRAIGAAIERDGSSRRVVVIGSGGLSHALPFPRWDAPETDDDEFLVRVFTHGRESWQAEDPRRRSIIRAATPDVREDLDREVLDRFSDGALAALADWSDEELEARGGNGAHEIRAWLTMAAACGHAPGRPLAYAPMPEWLTGMAVGVIDRPRPVPTSPDGGPQR